MNNIINKYNIRYNNIIIIIIIQKGEMMLYL